MIEDLPTRPLLWVASSKRDLMEMPQEVISDFGHGLYEAQVGDLPSIGKVLSGCGSASIVELVMDCEGNTFRAVYTVQKDLIQSRLKLAEEMYKEWKSKRKKK